MNDQYGILNRQKSLEVFENEINELYDDFDSEDTAITSNIDNNSELNSKEIIKKEIQKSFYNLFEVNLNDFTSFFNNGLLDSLTIIKFRNLINKSLNISIS